MNQKLKIINNRNIIAEIINKIFSVFENLKNLPSFLSLYARHKPYKKSVKAINPNGLTIEPNICCPIHVTIKNIFSVKLKKVMSDNY